MIDLLMLSIFVLLLALISTKFVLDTLIPACSASVFFVGGFIVLCLFSSSAFADTVKTAHAEVELIADKLDIRAGDAFSLSIRLKMDDHWHTYGEDPGDAGMPTRVEWILPHGFIAGEIQWPKPESIKESDVVTVNVYEGEVLLKSIIETSTDIVSDGKKLMAANVTWLSCNYEVCVSGEARLSVQITVNGVDAG